MRPRGGVAIRASRPLPERVELLETDLQEMRGAFEKRIEDAVAVVESRRMDELRRSLHLQEAGVGVFVFGLLLTTAGALL